MAARTGSEQAMEDGRAVLADAMQAEREVEIDAHEAPRALDERRMHVRAYNFWVSRLAGRAYPSVADLGADEVAEFASHAVLLDFTRGDGDPAITAIGDVLRVECGLDESIGSVADVPVRSLLSRLTDHYLQILANRAPIGFEAEFVGRRGNVMLYRGILMPFSSDDATIDHVYGVINWKELADPELDAGLVLEVADALIEFAAPAPDADATLADRLAEARASADEAGQARLAGRAALYRALGHAHDFALIAEARPADYAELLADAGIAVQARAPMTAVVKLVFGIATDKARMTEFAAALAHARRADVPAGGFVAHVEAQPGGLKALVAAERAARRPADAAPRHVDLAHAALRRIAPCGHVEIAGTEGEFVLLVARREEDGRLAVLAPVPPESALLDRAIRKITR